MQAYGSISENSHASAVTELKASFNDMRQLFFGVRSKAFLASAPSGQGDGAFMLPGMGGHESSLYVPGAYYSMKGHRVRHWKQNFNTGPVLTPVDDVEEVFLNAYEASGGRKFSLVCHSLGGPFAMNLAVRHPDKVKMIITKGSPINPNILEEDGRYILNGAKTIFNFITRSDPKKREEFQENVRTFIEHQEELGVPSTHMISKNDGGVGFGATKAPGDCRIREYIEVEAGHMAMGHNASVMYATADRLAQRDGEWTRFDAAPFPRHYPPQTHNDHLQNAP